MSDKKKKRSATSPQSLTFTLELYPEWTFFNDILAHIIKFKYAYIKHDKDKKENSDELKKEHCHVVVKYGNYRTLSSVQNEYKTLGLEERFVQTCNEKAMLRYLTHRDDPDKFQYSLDDVVTNMKVEIEMAYKDTINPDVAFRYLMEFINDSNAIVTQSDLSLYAMDNGYLKGMKMYQYQLNNIRIEHNKEVQKNEDLSHVTLNNFMMANKQITQVFETASVTGFDEVKIGDDVFQIARVDKPKTKRKRGSVFDEK